MSDYRNANYDYRNPNDPFRSDSAYDPNVRAPNAAWGWIAAAVFLVVVLAVAFGAGHKPAQLAQNDATPPAVHMAPPTAALPPTGAPAAGTPTPAPTTAPTTSTPAPTGQ